MDTNKKIESLVESFQEIEKNIKIVVETMAKPLNNVNQIEKIIKKNIQLYESDKVKELYENLDSSLITIEKMKSSYENKMDDLKVHIDILTKKVDKYNKTININSIKKIINRFDKKIDLVEHNDAKKESLKTVELGIERLFHIFSEDKLGVDYEALELQLDMFPNTYLLKPGEYKAKLIEYKKITNTIILLKFENKDKGLNQIRYIMDVKEARSYKLLRSIINEELETETIKDALDYTIEEDIFMNIKIMKNTISSIKRIEKKIIEEKTA